VTARLLALHASSQALPADLEVEPHDPVDAWFST
jgi:hypothetical protein